MSCACCFQVSDRCKTDEHAEELFKAITADSQLGRMTPPAKVSAEACKDKILSPRFAVEQGLKPDGSLKIRPIDDFTASGCNAHTIPAEKLKCDTLDLLLACMRRMFEDGGGKVPVFRVECMSSKCLL